MASLTPPRTRTLELETSALSHAVALAGWIRCRRRKRTFGNGRSRNRAGALQMAPLKLKWWVRLLSPLQNIH